MFRNHTLKIKINFIGKNGIYVCVCSIRSFTQTAVNSFNFFFKFLVSHTNQRKN